LFGAQSATNAVSAARNHWETYSVANFRLLEDKIAVDQQPKEEVTSGGIVLPDDAKKEQNYGTVIAVGPGRTLDNGERDKIDVAVGDTVYFKDYGGTDVEVEGKMVLILRRGDILLVVPKG
jgi:chaperonin GroES